MIILRVIHIVYKNTEILKRSIPVFMYTLAPALHWGWWSYIVCFS